MEEFFESPLDMRRGRLAAIVLHQMTDYWFLEYGSAIDGSFERGKISVLRDQLSALCADFGLIGGVADATKHASLRNGSRQITHADQVTRNPGIFGAPFGTAMFGEAAIVMISLNDGTERPLMGPVREVLSMWRTLLDRVSAK